MPLERKLQMQIKCFFSHNSRNEHVLGFFQVSNLTKAICSSVKWKTEYNSKRLCHTIQSWLGEFVCLSWVHEWSQHPFLCGLWWVFVGLSVCHTVIFPYYCAYEFITEVWASSLKKKKNTKNLIRLASTSQSQSLVLHKQQLVHGKSWPPGVIYQHKIYNVQLPVNGKLKYKHLKPWWLWRWFAEQNGCRRWVSESAAMHKCIYNDPVHRFAFNRRVM